MSIYNPISIALNIAPNENYIHDELDDSDIEPGNFKNSQTYNLEANRVNASKGGYAKAAKQYPAWNKGVKGLVRSHSSIEKQRKSITGKKRGPYNNYNYINAKSVVVNGKEYPSMAAACRDTGIGPVRIKKFLRTQQPSQELPASFDD